MLKMFLDEFCKYTQQNVFGLTNYILIQIKPSFCLYNRYGENTKSNNLKFTNYEQLEINT